MVLIGVVDRLLVFPLGTTFSRSSRRGSLRQVQGLRFQDILGVRILVCSLRLLFRWCILDSWVRILVGLRLL